MGSDLLIGPALSEVRLGSFRISAWTFPPAFLLIHGVIATCLPHRLDPLSTIFIVAGEFAAMAACLGAARTSSASRSLWMLLIGSTLFHSVAMSLDAVWEIRRTTMLNHIPALSILFSLLSGVWLLVAVSLQNDPRVRRAARIVQTSLSIAVGIVIYLQIFSFLSIHGSANVDDAIRVTRLFDIMDGFLAIGASLRWLGSSEEHERRFFGILTIFQWANTIFPAVHNRLLMRHDGWIWLDLLVVAPYVLLVPLAFTRGSGAMRPPSPALVRIVRAGSPVWLTAALIFAGILETRSRFYVGLAVTLFAIVAYGILNILIQSRGLETEESLRASKEALKRLVNLDSLTGVANRRAFDQALQSELAAALRSRRPVSLLMLDVDRFKELNDAKGHLKGDAHLIRIAGVLRHSLPRATDFVARYGGEEFSVILPATGATGAMEVAERLRKGVAGLKLDHPTAPAGIVTVSVGVSTFEGSVALSPGELTEAADRALYRAKRSGRNASLFEPIDNRFAARSSAVQNSHG